MNGGVSAMRGAPVLCHVHQVIVHRASCGLPFAWLCVTHDPPVQLPWQPTYMEQYCLKVVSSGSMLAQGQA